MKWWKNFRETQRSIIGPKQSKFLLSKTFIFHLIGIRDRQSSFFSYKREATYVTSSLARERLALYSIPRTALARRWRASLAKIASCKNVMKCDGRTARPPASHSACHDHKKMTSTPLSMSMGLQPCGLRPQRSSANKQMLLFNNVDRTVLLD